MTTDEIRKALRAEPFKPFAIHLSDGQSFDVVHPEFVIAPASARVIVVYIPNDGYNHVDVRMVTSLEFQGPGDPPSQRRAG